MEPFGKIEEILRDYTVPGLMKEMERARAEGFGRMLYKRAFLHYPEDIKPESHRWRRLMEVPEESDQCQILIGGRT